MIDFIIYTIINIFIKNNISFDKELIKYGILIIVRYSLCFIIAFIINVVTHSESYYIIFVFSFYLLRSDFGGLHFKNNTLCLIMSILFATIIPNIIKIFELNIIFIIVSLFLVIVILYIIGPIDNENKLLTKSEIIYHKKRGFIKVVVFLIITILIDCNIIQKCIIGSLYFQTIISLFELLKNNLHKSVNY